MKRLVTNSIKVYK